MKKKSKYYDDSYDNNGAVWVIIIAILLALLSSLFVYVKNNRVKVAKEIEKVCPKCNGIIKVIGGNEYIVDVNIESETIIEEIKLGGEKLKFEKNKNDTTQKMGYIKNKENINSGYNYYYDVDLNMFIYNGKYFTENGFRNYLKKEIKFNFDFNKDELFEDIDIIDDLDICFEDLIIDLGNKKVYRTYNIKFKNYVYIISFEDNLIVFDSSFTPKAYYENDLIEERKFFVYEPTGEKELNLKEELLDKIKFVDLEGVKKTPKFTIHEKENYDLISDNYIFNWFDEQLTKDYSITISINYDDLMGNSYEEIISVLFSQVGEPEYKDLYGTYRFKVGEYKTPIPTDIIDRITKKSLIESLVIDDSAVISDKPGLYIIHYYCKSSLSNIPYVKNVGIRIVE